MSEKINLFQVKNIFLWKTMSSVFYAVNEFIWWLINIVRGKWGIMGRGESWET